MSAAEVLEHVATGFELLAAGVLVLGMVWAVVVAVRVMRRTGKGRDGYLTLRETLGAVLLLSVEILVAADLIGTVAVEPTLERVAVLGLIVLIRTFLSFSLEIEMDGVAPWRRALVGGPSRIARAADRAGERTSAGR